MCGLCGLLGEDLHWTDSIQNTVPRRRERQRRIRAVNRVLKPFYLQVSDFQGNAYLIQSATGKQEIARGLEQLWESVERIIGSLPDPLDLQVIQALEASSWTVHQ